MPPTYEPKAQEPGKPGNVLLYKSNVKISDETMQRLLAAGFIPMQVDDVNDVKVLDLAGTIPVSALFGAAIDAIDTADANCGPKTRFGICVSHALRKLIFKT